MKTGFAMAIHFHQPVGNFDHIIERACEMCYVPFLDTLIKYPEIKMSFHFSGCLLEWVEENRPEVIGMVRDMVARGQVELISGGFYEPILPSIPPEDRIGQINMLTEYIETKFSFKASGAWVAERVWEPELPSTLYDAGIKYAILDDTHFIYSGIPKEKTYGFYMTEDNAKPVAVFPTDKTLRYSIPFKSPDECIEYMRGVVKKDSNALFVYGDDGEKFGEWPGTYDWVFKEKWLEKFFDKLLENGDWLETVTLSDCLRERSPEGRVYLPTTSYEEMLAWALPSGSQHQMEDLLDDIRSEGKEEVYKPFIRGGFWRNFLSKYPESNHMNKKMIYVSRKLDLLKRKIKTSSDLVKAEKELFRGQCNCAYWHGVFGGLYLFHLRQAIYRHLIKSEVLIDKIRYGKKQFVEAVVADIDADGQDEVVLENREFSLYFDPAEGGILKELDSKTACCNLTNSLARREEAYHRKVLEKMKKEQTPDDSEVKTIHDCIQVTDNGIKDHLDYDRYGRHGLVDHFFGHDVKINKFLRCDYTEAGDFIENPYCFEVSRPVGGVTLTMKRHGFVGENKVDVSKSITLPKKGASFKVKYRIKNNGPKSLDTVFAPEFNLTMPDADSDSYALVFDGDGKSFSLRDTAREPKTRKVKVSDSEGRVSFEMSFSEECSVWHFPVRTVSQSEKEYELNYQSSAILPRVKLKLAFGEEKRFEMEIRVDKG